MIMIMDDNWNLIIEYWHVVYSKRDITYITYTYNNMINPSPSRTNLIKWIRKSLYIWRAKKTIKYLFVAYEKFILRIVQHRVHILPERDRYNVQYVPAETGCACTARSVYILYSSICYLEFIYFIQQVQSRKVPAVGGWGVGLV